MRFVKHRLPIALMLIFKSLTSVSQPYFEPVSLSGSYFPKGDRQPVHGEKMFLLSFSMPLKLAPGKLLVVSPFQEFRGSYHAEGVSFPDFLSTAIPVSFLNYSGDSVWLVNITVINRWNQTDWEFNSDSWQIGGAVINTVKVNENMKLKFGLYYNREFFSDFFVPLGGIDWKISERLNLFGTLPNNMKLEYDVRRKLYTGFVFRSITNSYRNFFNGGGYYKNTDNQLGIFADALVTGKFVTFLEAGHTILKTTKGRIPGSFFERKSDSFYIRVGLAYRIRFDS